MASRGKELTKIREQLVDLSRTVETTGARTANEPWGGADVVITSTPQIPQVAGSFYPEPRYIITPHDLELSWIFESLRDIFLPVLDGSSKIEFFVRLANSANRFLSAEITDSDRADEIVRATLDAAHAILREMESGTFGHLDIALGNTILDDFSVR